jgi:hypothetical protein
MESRATLLQPIVGNAQPEANHLAQVDSSSMSFLRPGYQRTRGDDRNAERLSRPSGTILSIMTDIVLSVIALCFFGKAFEPPQFATANLPRSPRWPGGLDEGSTYRNYSRISGRGSNENSAYSLFRSF